ncbi:histidine kinase/DNA gyrase B/HSP90-like ATPase [Novosphingobium sp. PhB57]|uniref:sensor histidine kinase n=1 Tax=unclassified Novosphingobium TaxID=2644732 RepID=UPI001053C542|nr:MULTISPECIES: histidine kinase [unclassified Novosphingobium]TCU52766.1 histidine kinase/DNA gyrase B/HSP90-like ATPase [Novosphingobium sp. PhB57]TDW64040.1 histidine kinase/DNA gyrase B/HSP90-like ATPase [Novosphingobium sp. PhB55]
MSVLPIQPIPFFANKDKAFWRLQFVGWGGAMLLRAMSTIANAQPLSYLVLVLIATVTGFSISLVLSVVYRALITRRALVTWGLTAMILPFAVGLHAFIDAWVISLYRTDSDSSFAQLFIGVFYLDATLLGAWSALYYAINFYLQVEEQNDQMIRLENQATQAQLAMLRYQLNPHFLFNTLNSISTLVLLKQTEPANAMLSRLSSFLRYTLINKPSAQVTVALEVETLKLYLDIELMRFEERLRTTFNIDPETETCLLPSLLLQPLVENSIKYAVTPQESGAEITIVTQLVGPMLRITVSDTGPGLQSPTTDNRLSGMTYDGGEPVSTGVGLANIRDRLSQAYGEHHRFETIEPIEGGFAVLIELPAERQPTPEDMHEQPRQPVFAAR